MEIFTFSSSVICQVVQLIPNKRRQRLADDKCKGKDRTQYQKYQEGLRIPCFLRFHNHSNFNNLISLLLALVFGNSNNILQQN